MPAQPNDDAKRPLGPDSEARRTAGSWWQTLPGLLTAAAGILTAVSGLLVVLHQIGVLGVRDAPATAPSQPAGTGGANGAIQPTGKPSAASAGFANVRYSLTLPPNAELKFRNIRAEGNYKVQMATVEASSTGKLLFKFTVRLTNNGPSDVGFWNDTFRLVLDGVPVAPISYLNGAVDAASAKEAVVEFEGRDTVTDLALRIVVGPQSETADIPLSLKRNKN